MRISTSLFALCCQSGSSPRWRHRRDSEGKPRDQVPSVRRHSRSHASPGRDLRARTDLRRVEVLPFAKGSWRYPWGCDWVRYENCDLLGGYVQAVKTSSIPRIKRGGLRVFPLLCLDRRESQQTCDRIVALTSPDASVIRRAPSFGGRLSSGGTWRLLFYTLLSPPRRIFRKSVKEFSLRVWLFLATPSSNAREA